MVWCWCFSCLSLADNDVGSRSMCVGMGSHHCVLLLMLLLLRCCWLCVNVRIWICVGCWCRCCVLYVCLNISLLWSGLQHCNAGVVWTVVICSYVCADFTQSSWYRCWTHYYLLLLMPDVQVAIADIGGLGGLVLGVRVVSFSVSVYTWVQPLVLFAFLITFFRLFTFFTSRIL